MLIRGQQVQLQHFDVNHLHDPAYYGWLCDMEVVRYIGRDELMKGIPFEEAEKYVQQLWQNPFCSFFAVHDTASRKFIGTAKVNFMSEKGRKHGIADLGIMLGDRSFWGKGLSVDILRAVSIFAFDSLKARKLSAGAYSENIPVVRAFMRIGFKIDGTLRGQLVLDNAYCDHILMSCFENELIRE